MENAKNVLPTQSTQMASAYAKETTCGTNRNGAASPKAQSALLSRPGTRKS